MAEILEISRVTPFTADSPEYSPVSELSLPLTFCDTQWFKFPPVERLFFYSLAEPKETLLSSVLPRLKHSLSLTLRHFLPVAGTLTWPRDSPKPLVLYRAAPDDAVSLSVAESNADDFDVLCGDQPREAASFRCLVPELEVSETGASVVSLQVTLFPNRGFCIGVTCHHAVLDGKSATMFVKSWAHLCRENNSNAATWLPPELAPFLDRSAVRDPRDLAGFYLDWWLEMTESPGRENDPKIFEFLRFPNAPPDLVRATFTLSRADIASLRDKISSELGPAAGDLRLSAFVVAFSHAVHCVVESTSGKAVYGLTADLRRRLDPPVPENYFGNCVAVVSSFEDLRAAGATAAAVAASVGRLVGSLEGSDVTAGAEERMRRFARLGPVRSVGVAGSPRFGVYGVDFGWGPPRKVEVASIDLTGAVSMAESRDGRGGVEFGVVLKKDEMDIFASLFSEGPKK